MLEVYTDGGCNPNPGVGGWAYVIPSLGIEKSGFEPETTNNRMEIVAILEALSDPNAIGPVRIYSDSQLAINVLSGRWKAKKNLDLVQTGRVLVSNRRVVFQWVKGHNGNRHNERCDCLCTDAIKAFAEKSADVVDWRSF